MAIVTLSTTEDLDWVTQAKHHVLAKLPSSQPTYTILTLPGLVKVLRLVSYTVLVNDPDPYLPRTSGYSQA